MEFEFDDGGRAQAGFKGEAGDCAVRAIAIAAQMPYLQVYEDLRRFNKAFAVSSRSRGALKVKAKGGSPRDGNNKKVVDQYLETLGFKWVATMQIGSGCTTHLADGELPQGRIIARVTKHLTAVIDGVIRDTHDPSRGGSRCVYGYYIKAQT